MAKGIALPIGAVEGRLGMLEGDDYVAQLVRAALGPGDQEHPFERGGLGDWMIFDGNDETTAGEIERRARTAFASLEADQLARLVSLDVEPGDGGEMAATVVYDDLERGARPEIVVPLGGRT